MFAQLTLLTLWTANAAVPGFVLGEENQTAQALGSAIVIAPGGDTQRWTIAPHIAASSERIAILFPDAQASDAPPRRVSSAVLRQLDTFSAPRVESLNCDDLAKRDYLYTAPGCQTTEPEPLEGFAKPTASDAFPRIGAFVDASYEIEMLSTEGESVDALNEWLTLHGFQPLGTYAEASATSYGDDWYAIIANVGVADAGVWLPPLQLETSAVTMPLHLGTSDASAPQDITLWNIGLPDQGPLALNAPESTIPADCVLPVDASDDWYTSWTEQNRPANTAYRWSLEYYGPLSSCSRCTTDLLYSAAVLELGSYVGPADGWVSRVSMVTQPNLGPIGMNAMQTPSYTERSLVFVAYDNAITPYISACEEGLLEEGGRCPGLAEPAGCATSRTPPTLALGLTLCALFFRRTRVAAIVLLCWLPVYPPTAHAGTRPVPRADVTVGTNAWATPRLLPASTEVRSTGPAQVWSIDSHIAVAGWPKGALEATIGWSLYHGRPTAQGTRFTISEPQAGLTIRHGRYREKVSAFGRYGAAWVHTTVDSSVWRPHRAGSLRIHADGGLWSGRNGRRLSTFLRVSTIPRTDAWVVRFHPAAGLEGWTFLAGYVSASLHVGAAFP